MEFYCNICKKNYANKRNLLKHNRKVHNIRVGNPSYECSECSFQSCKKKDIISHVKIHGRTKIHGRPIRSGNCGKRLICPNCNETVQRYADLRKHITSVHNVQLITEKVTFDSKESKCA